MPVRDKDTDGPDLSEVADVENNHAAYSADNGRIRIPKVVISIELDHSTARFREWLRLVQVCESVLADMPSFNLTAAEACKYFIRRDLNHAVYLTKVTRKAY